MDKYRDSPLYLSSFSAQSHIVTASSATLRAISYHSLVYPYLLPWYLAAYLVPLSYLICLWSWLKLDRTWFASGIIGVREAVKSVQSEGHKMRRLNKVDKEVYIRRQGEVDNHQRDSLPPPSLLSVGFGSPTSNRWHNGFSLLLNTFLTIGTLDQSWSTISLIKAEDMHYSRTSGLTSHSSSLSFRLPDIQECPLVSRICYRPLLGPELLSVTSPAPWSLSEPVTLTLENDWRGQITLEDLAADTRYEYRLQSDTGNLYPSSKSSSYNFTTFPDPTLAKASGSHFRFIHAASAQYYTLPYKPWESLLSVSFLSPPFTTFSPSQVAHRFRTHRLRRPAWRTLSTWLADMRDRTARLQIQFALFGEDLELCGRKQSAMGALSDREKRESRQWLASHDIRGVYESLPILPSTRHSPSEGYKLEPAAVSKPSSGFSYGDAFFFRLRRPFVEHSELDSQDWQVDLIELSTWLASFKTPDSLKVLLSPITLSPFFGGSQMETAWRESVLDLIKVVPNVIVLAEATYGFSATILRRSIVEFASPALDQTPKPPNFLIRKAEVIPDIKLARTEQSSRWIRRGVETSEETTTETVDRLLNFAPNSDGARWTSFEVDSTGPQARVTAILFHEGQPFWRLDVIGSAAKRSNNAVGAVAETFRSMLKRLGLAPLLKELYIIH